MTIAMYATIWAAMLLFVAGEAGKGRAVARAAASWPWRAWLVGVALCAVHVTIAMAVHHGWDHEHAIRETMERTAEVYGVGPRAGLYVNYLFVVAWAAEVVWWAAWPILYAGRPPALTWALRAFYFIIIVNGVVIFASPQGRVIGVPLVAYLLWVWARAAPASSEQRVANSE